MPRARPPISPSPPSPSRPQAAGKARRSCHIRRRPLRFPVSSLPSSISRPSLFLPHVDTHLPDASKYFFRAQDDAHYNDVDVYCGATPARDCLLHTPPPSTATPPNPPARRRERPGMLHSSPLLPARFSGEAPPPPRHCRRNHGEHLFSLVFPANVFLSRNVRWPGGQRSHTHTAPRAREFEPPRTRGLFLIYFAR